MENTERVIIQFTKTDAIVFFDFVSRFTESGELSIHDQAEERVIWDICSQLETMLAEPFSPDWANMLSFARKAVRDVE